MDKNDGYWSRFFNRSTPQAREISAAVLLLILGFGLLGCQSSRLDDAAQRPGFKRLLDAVVRIDVREASYESGMRRLSRGVGSGVILDKEGFILTNAHVVSRHAEEIIVTLPNLEKVSAELVGWDHWTDLALIKLNMELVRERGLSFEASRFGDSNKLATGQTVYAVGTPNGLTRTVSRGIISNPNRYFSASNQIRGYETGYFNTWLQTDAAINPGNSGGPLIDEWGHVVGINTRSYLGANNLSFAVPISIAKEVIPSLKKIGEVERSYIGIKPAPMQDLESFFGLKANRGLLIESVDPGSPGATSELIAGDILLEMNGIPLDGRYPEQIPPILHAIAVSPVGSQLEFLVRRGSEEFKVQVETERLESRVGQQTAFEKWGMSVQEVSKAIARERQFKSDDGVLVLGVQQAFPAQVAGLGYGDIILSANRQPIQTLDELKLFYDSYAENPQKVLLEVMRNFQVKYVVIEPR